MSTNGLSHITVDRKHLNASKAEGLACGIGLQRIKKPVKLTWRAEGANERHGGTLMGLPLEHLHGDGERKL